MPLKITSRSRAPSYSKEDYPHIQRGFIAANFHPTEAIETYYCANNETANVYTQLAGLLTFMFMFFTLHVVPDSKLINTDEYPKLTSDQIESRRFYYQFAVASTILCATSSLLTHTLQARNRVWHDFLAICDWGGTLVICFCTTVAIDLGADAHEIIQHHIDSKLLQDILIFSTGPEHLKMVYIALTVTLAILTFVQTSHAFRFLLIFGVIIFCSIPIIGLNFSIFPVKSLISISCMAGGGFFFGSHFPEVWFPRTFDIVLPSHALWHIGYQLCLVLAFDSMSIFFFGKSCYSFENVEAAFRELISYMVLLV